MSEEIIFKLKLQLSQGKLTIPVKIRKLYGIRNNEVVELTGYKDYIILKPTGTTIFTEVISK